MTFFYRTLLHLYPRGYRARFGAEMLSVFADAAEQHCRRGWAAYLLFAAKEYAGLVAGSCGAWAWKLSGGGFREDQPLVAAAGAAHLPPEVQEAQDLLNVQLNRLLHAISHHQYVEARRYAAEEQKARQALRLLREKYHIAESGEAI